MGPGLAHSLPACPRFAWDAKSLPCTDRKGNQERHQVAVDGWKEFHDCLEANNPNEIFEKMQGLILKSQLYGQATNLCSELSKNS